MRADKQRRLRCSWLAPLIVAGVAACCCPKPEVPRHDLTPEEAKQVSVAREYLAAADTKKTWSPEDDKKYRATIANLPQETKFQLTKDLFVRLNSQEIKVLHKPRGTGPQLCAPALCEASPVQRQDPKTTGKVDAK